MNRNVESHFSELPKIDIERSMFDRSCSHKTSFNVGEVIPYYIDEVLPGDTFNITTSAVVRLQTPINPIMDNIYMDTYFFFVPNRLVWIHWKEFCGENNDSAWIPSNTYSIPKLRAPTGGWNVGTIADYMGIPTGVGPYSGSETKYKMINALPFRAYALICDEFFRDQNLQDPLIIYNSDSTQVGSNGSSQISDIVLGGKPFIACKFHDYFTSCLPSPQKGTMVDIFANEFNQTESRSWMVPVTTGAVHTTSPRVPMQFYGLSDGITYFKGRSTSSPTADTRYTALSSLEEQDSFSNIIPSNLWADLGYSVNVNDLRIAFQVQKYFERNARSGTRYREILKAHFGITSSDARMQIPEYLGGHRFPLNIHQVASTSENQTLEGETTYIGDLGAMSNTADIHDDFIKSFEEHGFVIGLAVVRYDHSYPQGLERFWSRSEKLDYYWPVFSNIGEQPVFKNEIKYDSSQTGYEVFGYQEAWSEYRYKPNRVSAEMRPGVSNSLANWHLADNYLNTPSLSASWIREDVNNVDRVLTVGHGNANQVFADFYVKNIATRPMPMYSIPGLIDHH